MEETKDFLTPEEIEQILRKLEVEYPELANPEQTGTSEKTVKND